MVDKEEITFDEISSKPVSAYTIIDIRDEAAFAYGHIAGAVNIPLARLSNDKLPKNRELYICCRVGDISRGVAEELRSSGFTAYSVKGGYAEWLRRYLSEQATGNSAKAAEQSIRKQMRKKLLSPFIKGIKNYGLIEPNDKIAVCISGGKDSFLMAKLFMEYKKYCEIDFSLVFLSMDPGYSRENREIIEQSAKMLNIPLTFFETDIFKSVYKIEKSPCYVCARMRRGHLYNKARELGCNKIALGHHYDDVIETILMGMLYGGQVQTMMPKLKSTNFAGMELIRPMYLVREDDIKEWRDANGLRFIQCACLFTDTCTTCGPTAATASKRQKIKNLIREIKSDDPEIERNIFKSVENVNLATVIAYKDKDGRRHNFTDDY